MTHMSGHQFAAFLKTEIAAQNKGLGKLTYEALGRSCGVTGRYLRTLARDGSQNPSVLTIRLVLFTLGYEVEAPEDDVLPHLKGNGSYVEELHGTKRSRRTLQRAKVQTRGKAGGVH
jgi:signal recognition particle subunit SEC65